MKQSGRSLKQPEAASGRARESPSELQRPTEAAGSNRKQQEAAAAGSGRKQQEEA